ncbi:MAG: type II toxin-antitoxin system VapC family toxin [Deltaproteobacteria bacterium]|nr:type II toxin-antitoxin system VapC family toxin [Deltaproteobacteria bacterium]
MQTGVDTGFFFLLEEQNSTAVDVWKNGNIITSAVVVYELQKKLLQGRLKELAVTLIEDIRRSVNIISLNAEISLFAAHLAHETHMPGLDALILSSLLDAGCRQIYTTDQHFELYKKEGIEIINLKTGQN